MGLAMATNMQKHMQQQQNAFPPLKYWNRTLARGKPLDDLGAIACPTIAELAQTSDVIFISVSPTTLHYITATEEEEEEESKTK